MRRILRPVRRTLLTLLPLVALLLLHAPAATAAPTITGSNCNSGASKLICYVWYSNSVGSVSITWHFYQGSNYHFSASGDSTGIKNCQSGRMYTYYVYVTDSTGTAQGSGNIYCSPYAWP